MPLSFRVVFADPRPDKFTFLEFQSCSAVIRPTPSQLWFWRKGKQSSSKIRRKSWVLLTAKKLQGNWNARG